MKLTLNEYLKKGIDKKDQIILINNPPFYKRYGIFNQFSKKVRIFFVGRKNKGISIPDFAIKKIKKISKFFPRSESIILLGKTDKTPEDIFLDKIPRNILRIYSNNSIHTNPKIRFFPMGRDFRNMKEYSKDFNISKKKILCYSNFSLDTHPVRQLIYDLIKNKDFITFEHMGENLKYPISRKSFLDVLATSKYCICPRGNALDTFRFWDCLYMGVIPIVVKEKIHKELTNLPILFLKSEKDFNSLTKKFLEEKYKYFLNKKYNYNLLKMSFWFNKIERDAENEKI